MFTSRYVKHSKLLLRHAQKYLRYKNDVLDPTDHEEVAAGMRRLHAALRQRDRKQIESRAEELDQKLHKGADQLGIALAGKRRSDFGRDRGGGWDSLVLLQPFKIPTGSMQPTLNGIIGYPLNKPAPNLLRRMGEFVVLGRNYIDVVSHEDDQILNVQPKKFLFFFTFSRVICQHQTFLVYAPPGHCEITALVVPGKSAAKGEALARGDVITPATRFSSTSSATTFLNRIAAMFSFSGRTTFRSFAKIRKQARLSTSSAWRGCPVIRCGLIRRGSTSITHRRNKSPTASSA